MKTQIETKKILVVEDEPDVSVYLSRLLAENGFQVASAANGAEALKAVAADPPDLITLDLSLPETSGVGFYREIKSRPDLSRIPVVFVTGITGIGGARDTERFYATRAHLPPPDGFVAKPIEPQEVLNLVNKLLAIPQ